MSDSVSRETASDEEPDPVILAQINQMIDLETSGTRTTLSVGPFSAYTLIGCLQMVMRRMDLPPNARPIIRHIVRQLYPLFDGTPVAEHIRRGEHPEWQLITDDLGTVPSCSWCGRMPDDLIIGAGGSICWDCAQLVIAAFKDQRDQ